MIQSLKQERWIQFVLLLVLSGGLVAGMGYSALNAAPDRRSHSESSSDARGHEADHEEAEEDQKPPPSSTVEPSEVPKILKGHDRYYRVEYVYDGDSLRLRCETEIRFIGVDAPEKSQKYDDQARAFVRKLLPRNKIVAVDFDRTVRDRYGRLLGYVYTIFQRKGKKDRKIMINEALLKRGLAHTYLHKHNTRWLKRFIAAQRSAMKRGRPLFHHLEDTSDRYIRVHGNFRYHRPGCKYVKDVPKRKIDVFSSRRKALYYGCNGASCCFKEE